MKKYFAILTLFISFVTLANAGDYFIKNESRFSDETIFYAETPGMRIWGTNSGIIFDKFSIEKFPGYFIKSGAAIQMEFANSTKPEIIFQDEEPFSLNYIYRAGGENRSVSAKAYKQIIVKNIYPGIDARYYFDNGKFRYDFIVAVGANPNKIQLKFNGADKILVVNGAIKFSANNIEFNQTGLKAYQNIKSNSSSVNCNFRKGKNDCIEFKLGKFDRKKDLIIDPLIFSTFIGGKDYEYVRSMDLNSKGEAVLVGNTLSVDFPTTLGAYQEQFTENDWGFHDAFISKFDSTGKKLIFSTFIGGMGDDYAEAVKFDKNDNVFVTGYTMSLRSFPYTNGAIDSIDRGGYDAFLLKLSASGDSLIYSTLIGGAKDDYSEALAVDSSGNAYIAGYSDKGTFPTTPGAYCTVAKGDIDCFAAKINPGGTALIYSTLIGGTKDDYAQAIDLDSAGFMYIGGVTASGNMPISSGAYKTVYGDSANAKYASDAFILKLNQSGTGLIYSTFLGASGKDGIYSVKLAKNGVLYAGGYTESKDFPVTPLAFDTTYNNIYVATAGGDAFVSALSANGSNLLYSTFLGGKGSDRIWSVDIDEYDNIYATGTTNSSDFPTTRFAFDRTYNDTLAGTDAFGVKFDSKLKKLAYSTYLGGISSDAGASIKVYKDYSFYISGWTSSRNFPYTNGVFDGTYNDTARADGFLTRIEPNLIDLSLGDNRDICFGDTILIGSEASGGFGDLTYEWFPKDFVQSPNSPFTKVSPNKSILYYLVVKDSRGNTSVDSVQVNVSATSIATLIGSQLVETGSSYDYEALQDPEFQFFWIVTNGTIVSGQNTPKIKIKWSDNKGEGKASVKITNKVGCSSVTEMKVYIGKKYDVKLNYSGKVILCSGDTLILDAGSGFQLYKWSNNVMGRRDTIVNPGKYWVLVFDSLGFSGMSDTITVESLPKPVPVVIGRDLIKTNLVYSYITMKNSGSQYLWTVEGGTILTGQGTDSINVKWQSPFGGSVVVQETSIGGCKATSTKLIVKSLDQYKPTIRILGSDLVCTGDSVLLDAGYGFSNYDWNNGKKTRFITVKSQGLYWAIVKDVYGFVGATDTVNIKFATAPAKPTVKVVGGLFTCEVNNIKYQWFRNDSLLVGDTLQAIYGSKPGRYRVRIQSLNGCVAYSDIIYYLVQDVDYTGSPDEFFAYPNPAKNEITILYSGNEFYNLKIVGLTGEIYKNASIEASKTLVNVADLQPGVYYLELSNGQKYIYKKIMIIK